MLKCVLDVWHLSKEMLKASFDSMNMSLVSVKKLDCRHTVWSLVIGGFFTWVSVYGINQTQVQRYLTVKKRSQAVKWETFMCVPIAADYLTLSPHCLQGNLVQCSWNRKPVTAVWLRRHGKLSMNVSFSCAIPLTLWYGNMCALISLSDLSSRWCTPTTTTVTQWPRGRWTRRTSSSLSSSCRWPST